MLSRKSSKPKAKGIAAVLLFLAGSAIAQEFPSRRMPHPPTSRPPEFTTTMHQEVAPPSYVPEHQTPAFASIQYNQPDQPRQTVEPSSQRVRAVPPPQPFHKPEPIRVVQSIEAHPVVPAMQQAETKPGPGSLSGYIVFVAGALLLARKPEDQ